MGGGVGGRLKRKEIYVYLWLIHVVVQQKLAQHCKAIVLQLKIKFKNLAVDKNQQDRMFFKIFVGDPDSICGQKSIIFILLKEILLF